MVWRLPLLSVVTVATSISSYQIATPPGASPVAATVITVPTGPVAGDADSLGATTNFCMLGSEPVVIRCSPAALYGIVKVALKLP